MLMTTFKVILHPNKVQESRFRQFAGASRFAYNWAIGRRKYLYEDFGQSISVYDLRKEFTQLKCEEEYFWLNTISNNVLKQAIKDADRAYQNFFRQTHKFPRFKSKKKSTPSFYIDPCVISFTDTHVIMEKISLSKKQKDRHLNYIKLAEKDRIPRSGVKYYNPRVKFDGINWYITVSCEALPEDKINNNEGIGIDLGIKKLAVCSDGVTYNNINKSAKVKKLEKKKTRIQRKVSRKYEMNKDGEKYHKTNNIKKEERRLLIINRKLKNLRTNYLHQTTFDIMKRNPSFVVLEDLAVSGMMKNKHLAKSIQDSMFREFRRQIEYKCLYYGSELIIANRRFPSSKKCCVCGNIKHNLSLSERTYVCSKCSNNIDRDFQASVNLRNYGKAILYT
jgi:putative transposase